MRWSHWRWSGRGRSYTRRWGGRRRAEWQLRAAGKIRDWGWELCDQGGGSWGSAVAGLSAAARPLHRMTVGSWWISTKREIEIQEERVRGEVLVMVWGGGYRHYHGWPSLAVLDGCVAPSGLAVSDPKLMLGYWMIFIWICWSLWIWFFDLLIWL